MNKLNYSQRSVITALTNHGTMTRRVLCSATGLSWAAISKTVSQLQKMQIIDERNSVNKTSRGRHPESVQLSRDSYMIGIGIRRETITVSVASLYFGHILAGTLDIDIGFHYHRIAPDIVDSGFYFDQIWIGFRIVGDACKSRK